LKTAEELIADFKSVTEEFWREIEKGMDAGLNYQAAVMKTCRDRPDLLAEENRIRDTLKALRRHGEEVQRLEKEASMALSCAAVSRIDTPVKRLPIAQLGVRYKGSQRVSITRDMLAQVVANFRKRDTGEVPIDYDHSIETAAGGGAPVPAAGWIKSVDDYPDGQGILWGAVQWTPKAESMILSGEYKYISPVLDPTVRDNKTGQPQGWTLTSAALTNQPVLQGMPPLVLSEAGCLRSGGSGLSTYDALVIELNARVKATMAEKKLDYAGALRSLLLSDRDLNERYALAEKQRRTQC